MDWGATDATRRVPELGPPDSLPRLDRCGPYELLEPLARGANAVVYRARHRESGDQVALKTLRAADPFVLERLRREAHALSRIRHPGVVRLLAYGVERGLPWYAMELIEGGTLAVAWGSDHAAETARPIVTADATRRSLRLLQRLCAPLAFLHSEGIVHRDLKPANIAIRPHTDEPIIVDFGLVGYWSARLAREALQAGGELIGTVSYIAPEQAHGEYVDARADLYSLGCILYEAVTGAPPFDGTAGEILVKHLERPPLPPSRLVADLDPRLEALILRLLEKEPRRRMGFADDVAAVLGAVIGTPDAPLSDPVGSYLYRPSFVGRDGARRELFNALEAVQQGRGACFFVAGESGSGKTRFAMEITRAATARNFAVITGECAPVESAQSASQMHNPPLHPLQPLMRAVADRCVRDGPTATARLLGRRAKVLSMYEPLLRSVPGYDEQPEPAALPPAAERVRVLSDLGDLLALLGAEAPVLLVLDDLQWADDMTLALLESLGDAFLERARVLVLGSFRVEEVASGLAGLLQAPHVHRLALGRLDSHEISAMVSSMLAIDPPPRRLVRLLDREAEGNPFFVGEYLRAAVEAGLLRRAAAVGWQVDGADRQYTAPDEPLPLPHTLRELIGRRIATLEPATAAFMEAGAVLGREFDIELARELLEGGEPDTVESVHQLLQRQILEEVLGTRLRFVHDKLREAAYARLAAPAAARLHGRAATAIEARHTSDSLPLACVELAHHWERTGANDRAVHYLGIGGERALTTGAYKDAHLMISRALALDDGVADRPAVFRRARWQRMLGVASFGIGNLDASIDHSAQALVGLRERVPHSNAGWAAVLAWELGRALLARGERPRSPARRDTQYEVAQACGQLATSHFYNADVVPAAANLLRGLNRARRAGDDVIVAESYARIGYVAGAIGLGPVARAMFRRAHATADRAHDTGRRALSLYLEAMYREFLGQWDVCRELAENAAEILAGIGDLSEAETARAIASHGYFFAGHLRQARELGASILRTAEDRSHKHHIGWGLYLVARCDVVLGDFDAAIARLEEARVLLAPLPDLIDIIICEGWLARALVLSERPGAATDVATTLGQRITGGKRPAVGQCVDGYAGWAELALAVWERTPDSPTAARDALRACAELRRFARIFRMARPAAQRAAAHALWLRGRREPALRRWNKSIQTARALRMPYEEARAHAALARVSAGADATVHRDEVRRLGTVLGCHNLTALD